MEMFGMTDKGNVRLDNQDAFAFEMINGAAVLAVCDGMGGERGGEIASAIALQSFMETVRTELDGEATLTKILEKAAKSANYDVYERAMTDPSCRGMGTTLVGAIVKDGAMAIINVGDSRAYLLSDGMLLRKVTRDHSIVEDMVEFGALTREEARTHPRRNIITRVIGAMDFVECDLFTPEFSVGDSVLLCSDGLTGELRDSEILAVMTAESTAKDMCARLMETALERVASDNVTVAILMNKH